MRRQAGIHLPGARETDFDVRRRGRRPMRDLIHTMYSKSSRCHKRWPWGPKSHACAAGFGSCQTQVHVGEYLDGFRQGRAGGGIHWFESEAALGRVAASPRPSLIASFGPARVPSCETCMAYDWYGLRGPPGDPRTGLLPPSRFLRA